MNPVMISHEWYPALPKNEARLVHAGLTEKRFIRFGGMNPFSQPFRRPTPVWIHS